MGLCVWSFPDTNVEDQYPCYLMALDLKKRRGEERKSACGAGWNGGRPVSTITRKTMRTLLHEGYSVQKRGCRTGLELSSRAAGAWPPSF